MNKKRTVVLFGAGAVISWGGPKTSELTKLIIKDSAPQFICNDGKTKVTEFIYHILLKNGYKEEEINFETIISVIEELIIHYAYFDNKKELPSLHKYFFYSNFEEIISNFSIHGGQKKHLYKLDIPKGKEYHFAKSAYNNEPPEQFYYQHLLTELLTNINAKVSNYSYHTKGHSAIFKPGNNLSTLNQCFQKWIQKISENNVIRMYTLNYDRLFKVLTERVGIPVFEGFDGGEFVHKEGVLPNLQRILTDYESHIHYNLHGSAFWKVNARDDNSQLFNPWLSLQPTPILAINYHESAVLQMEKGKNILISNIITGYQKTQKLFITPFKQMQSAFDKDCCLVSLRQTTSFLV